MSRQAPVERVCGAVGSAQEVVSGDRFPAVRAVPAGAQATAEDVAVWAPLLAEAALLAFGTLVDGGGAPRGWCR
jgi:hypothetical protein